MLTAPGRLPLLVFYWISSISDSITCRKRVQYLKEMKERKVRLELANQRKSNVKEFPFGKVRKRWQHSRIFQAFPRHANLQALSRKFNFFYGSKAFSISDQRWFVIKRELRHFIKHITSIGALPRNSSPIYRNFLISKENNNKTDFLNFELFSFFDSLELWHSLSLWGV